MLMPFLLSVSPAEARVLGNRSIAPNPDQDKCAYAPFVRRRVRREERDGKAAKAKGERRKGLKPGDE